SAALQDPRFAPVTSTELPNVRIEISALTPVERCPDPALIKIGVHGLMLEWEGRRGLLLPQVPVEWGWDRHTFLQQLCRKANVPENTWQQPKAILQWFQAQVFGE
ncbi:MAG: AmmeMemoRadiSam system protein A, partial [bacterium]